MSLLDAARHRLRNLLRPDAADRERNEEFAFHQSLAEADHVHATGDASHAPYAARRDFGNVTRIKEELRWMGATRWIDQLGQDLRLAARMFLRSPVFAIVATMSIGLSVAANAAVFAVIERLMFARLAVSHPEQLVQLWRADGRGGREPYFNLAEYEALRASSGADLSLLTESGATGAQIAGTSYDRVPLSLVDGGLFPMLGVGAAAGRLLTPADDREASPVVVLGYGSALRYFGSAAAAVGQQITLQGQTFSIVGVLPQRFRGLHLQSPLTIVMPRNSDPWLRTTRRPDQGVFLTLIARVPAEDRQRRVALERAFASCCANGELVTTGVGTVNPIQGRGQRLVLTDISRGIASGKFDVRAMFARLLYTLMGGVAIILLIACTNIGSLQLARATVRSRELAVRMSLGASRGRIVRQLLAESVLLATIGSSLGVALAVWGTALLAERLPGNVKILQPFVALTPNLTLVVFTAGIAALCTVIVGVLPAMRATRLDPVVGLRTRSAGSATSNLMDRCVIAVQVALALVLVASAGLLGATLRNLSAGVGSLDPDWLLVAEVEARETTIPQGRERAVYDRILERLRSVPGVSAVAGTDVMPLLYLGFNTRTLDIPGFEDLESQETPLNRSQLSAGVIRATPGFFATTGSGLIAGREFNDGDTLGSQPVVIINETIARQFFAGRDPIGQLIGFRGGPRTLQVIGVTRDVKQTDLRAPHPRTVYLPRAQRENDSDRFIYAMRTSVAAANMADAAQAAIAAAAPEITIRGVQPMSDLVAFSVARERALSVVAIAFSIVAVGLAAIGLYGVMAFQVAARSREIGIRMALGADRTHLVRMVMRQSLLVVAAGVIAGVPLALAASSAMRALLYGVEPFAPAPLVIAVAVLVGAGIVAALFPSRNASRVDPLLAIRAE